MMTKYEQKRIFPESFDNLDTVSIIRTGNVSSWDVQFTYPLRNDFAAIYMHAKCTKGAIYSVPTFTKMMYHPT
jgi:hypothetical protein